MGCCQLGIRRSQQQVEFKGAAIVPEPPSCGAAFTGHLGASNVIAPAEPPPEQDLGDSDEDDVPSSDSSMSNPTLPPELQWAKQARRQARQDRRSRRAAREARRVAAAHAAGTTEGECKTEHGARRCWAELYSIGDRIGRGAFASVSRCTHLPTESKRAVKSIDRRKGVGEDRVQEEIEIMRMVNHPHVIRLFDVFDEQNRVYIVMELCTGGELLEDLSTSHDMGYADSTAAHLVSQLGSGVRYLHSIRVAHRDLKPENFLFARSFTDGGDAATGTLKIIDFGLSRRFEHGQTMRTFACSTHYVAPEVMLGEYTETIDLWSFGVIVFVMLSGSQPFHGQSEEAILAKARGCDYSFDGPAWARQSAASKDLVRRLLRTEASTRLTALEIMEHPWLRDVPLMEGANICDKPLPTAALNSL
eukprot:TRINITY_DN6423_c1_g1_i1.p1 TRINITY_DN6423_c1_g1~~TRINITY_DN6423_c1_g1_i1.p1  ORF type:complete len:418 (+),score=61.32 TRINITY_DN6423_c1_g1_i1:210-1463(+)